jgi:hypothetical protein
VTTDEKSAAILRKVVEVCNTRADEDPTGAVVSFGPDWGGNALTVSIGEKHTHVGQSDGSFENLVDRLYKCLVEERPGMSWE